MNGKYKEHKNKRTNECSRGHHRGNRRTWGGQVKILHDGSLPGAAVGWLVEGEVAIMMEEIRHYGEKRVIRWHGID